MAIDKIFDNASVDGIADNLFKSVSNSVSEVKAMQQRKAAENVQLVIQALKKIESDIQDKYDGVTTVIEKRVSSIKDGRDGRDGVDGKAGKDGRPGRDGATGLRGIDGKNGVDGVDGDDGVSVVDAHIDFDGSLIIGLSSGRAINVGEVVAPDLAEKIKVITNGGGTSQSVLDTLTSLQNQINLISSALVYKGTWNASTNTPTLASGVGTANTFYIVSVAGTTTLNGVSNWGVGDWATFNGTIWQRVEGGAAGNFTDLSVSGSMTFTGTGNRITGDFSNGTFANRVAIQTSTTNGATTVNAIPNGTGTSSQFIAHNAADPDNAGRAGFNVGASIAYFFSDTSGTGTYVPIAFRTSGSNKLTIAADTTGTYTFGGTAPRITGDFTNATLASRVAFQTTTVNGNTNIPVIPNGTGVNAFTSYYNNSDPTNASVATIGISGSTDARFNSGISGTGTYLPITFYTGGAEAMRIAVDAGGIRAVGIGYTTLTGVGDNGLAVLGNVGIGTSSPASLLHVDNGLITAQRYGTSGAIVLRSAAGTQGSPTAIASSTIISGLTSRGYDGTAYRDVSGIQTYSDGAISSSSSPGYLSFLTTPSGSVSSTERMRIDSSGNVGIGTSSPSTYGKFGVVSGANYFGVAAGIYNSVSIGPRSANDGYASVTYSWSTVGSGNFWVNDYSSGGIEWVRFTSGVSGGVLMRLDSSGNLLITNPAGLGYGTGSGGTVTQATDKSTAVTLNKPTGQITMNNAALAGNTAVVFRLNDSLIASVDTVIYAASGNGNYEITTHAIFAGAVDIRVTNATVGSLSEALVINFSILKGATS